jgi:hypothetical protein
VVTPYSTRDTYCSVDLLVRRGRSRVGVAHGVDGDVDAAPDREN